MKVRKRYDLIDELANEYSFSFDGDLCIRQGDATIAVASEHVRAFMRQLNLFVEREQEWKKA